MIITKVTGQNFPGIFIPYYHLKNTVIMCVSCSDENIDPFT